VPGWIFLVLIVLGFYAVVSRSWDYNAQDVTIDAWSCLDTITETAASSMTPDQAGCTPNDVDGEISVYHRTSPLSEGAGRDPLTVPGVDADSIELNLQLRLESPASSVVLVDASGDPVGGGVAMSSDKAGVRWSAPFRLKGSTEFVLLVGPPPEAE
jgi:hypothetical protein